VAVAVQVGLVLAVPVGQVAVARETAEPEPRTQVAAEAVDRLAVVLVATAAPVS